MRVAIKTIACVLVVGIALMLRAADESPSVNQDPDGIRKFYEKYPWLVDFYPMGIYGLFSGWRELSAEKIRGELSFEMYTRYNINAIWHTSPFMKPQPEQGGENAWPNPAKPELSDFGRWYYGELCQEYGIRSLVGMAPWLRFTEMKKKAPKLYRNAPLATDEELAPLEKELAGVFAYCRKLREDYPRTIMGFVTDDEPNMVAMAESGYRMVYRNLDAPPMTCNPTFSGVQTLVPCLQPITGDWYLNHREGWQMAPQMRWINENYPGAVFQLMLWTTGSLTEWNESVLPGLRDSRPWRTELRHQAWQGVALGSKGFWAFLPGYLPGFFAGGPALTNCLLEPDPVHGHMEEWGSLGEVFTSIGPLLLTCRSEVRPGVQVKCRTIQYRPYFDGAAVDYGLLKDLQHDRYFLIPWNNNVDGEEKAALSLPQELLNGRKVYDMMALKEMALENGNTLSVSLIPGGGQIFLVATTAEFDKCRDTVGRNRVSHARTLAMIERRQLKAYNNSDDVIDTSKADSLFVQAELCEKKKEWFKALPLYEESLKAAFQSEAASKPWTTARSQLKRMAQALSVTDDLFRSYLQLLEIPFDSNYSPAVYSSKYVGKETKDWAALSSQYFSLLKQFREGGRSLFSLANTVDAMVGMAEGNKAAVEAVIAKRLAEVRSPVRLALVTEDRSDPENSIIYTWAYQNFPVDWFTPDGKGSICDSTGKELDPARYDAIWIHQLSYREKPVANAVPEPTKVLMAGLVKPETVKAMSSFVQNGGGLLLSGVAGLYTMTLELETVQPDQIHENDYVDSSFGIGLVAAPGFSNHPSFKSFPAEGFFTNGNWPKRNLMAECAYKKKAPSGRVVATELDVVYGPMDPYAAMVEYRSGKGKVIMMGGRSCDYTPYVGFSLPHESGEPAGMKPGSNIKWNNLFGLRERLRLFTRNTLEYLATKNSFFEPDAAEAGKAQAARKAVKDKRENDEGVELPSDKWLFKPDSKDVGEKEKWFEPAYGVNDWKTILVGICWDSQGYENLTGYAWYRRSVQLANEPGKKTFLRFGAVDESAAVYLDGKKIGDADVGWDKPFEFDITSFLTDTPADHVIAVRIYNRMAAGGIWKPVYLAHRK